MTVFGNNAADLALFDQMLITDAELDGAEVALFVTDTEITRNTVLADLVEANYTGYAREVVPAAEPSISDNGVPEVVWQVGEFRPTGTTVTNNIFAGALIGSTGLLLRTWRFDPAPMQMNSPLDVIQVTFRFRLGSDSSLVVVVS